MAGAEIIGKEELLEIQELFEKDKTEIFLKAVLNDVESLSQISTCNKIEKFDQQS